MRPCTSTRSSIQTAQLICPRTRAHHRIKNMHNNVFCVRTTGGEGDDAENYYASNGNRIHFNFRVFPPRIDARAFRTFFAQSPPTFNAVSYAATYSTQRADSIDLLVVVSTEMPALGRELRIFTASAGERKSGDGLSLDEHRLKSNVLGIWGWEEEQFRNGFAHTRSEHAYLLRVSCILLHRAPLES